MLTARKITIVSGIIFAGAIVVFGFFAIFGQADPDNWAARIFVAGWGAIFTSAAMNQLLLSTKWTTGLRWAAVTFNAIVVFAALMVLASLIWNQSR